MEDEIIHAIDAADQALRMLYTTERIDTATIHALLFVVLRLLHHMLKRELKRATNGN